MRKKLEKVLLAAAVGPFAIGGSFLRTFSETGRKAACVNSLEYFPIRFGLAGRVVRRLAQEKIVYRYNRSIRDTALWMKPDLLLIITGNLVRPWVLSQVREKLPRTLLVNIHNDDYFSPSTGNRFPGLEQSVPLYHWMFPSKRVNVEELRRLGAEMVHYLPLGYDPAAFYPVRPSRDLFERYRRQLAFFGTCTPERARFLSALAGFSLSIWGPGWNRPSLGRALRRQVKRTGNGRSVWGAELSAILSSARIGLNFLRSENRDTHNHRSFELPACGVFTLTQRSEELANFFVEGKEIACFSSPAELRDKARYYLEHDRERESIARAGYRRLVEGKHTVRDRVIRMLEIMGLE